jgi:glycosyltransferase involved in cell wall biosynthesis
VAEARGLPFVFDTRGLWADEKVDGGDWAADSGLYRAAKRVERALFARADAVTVLTDRFRAWLREIYPHRAEVTAPVVVIPTCADLEVFRPTVVPLPAVARLLRPDAKVLVYVGSLSGRYLVEDMARFYLAWRAAAAEQGHAAQLLVVSRETPTRFLEVLGPAGCASELVHTPAARDEVAGAIRCAHAGVFFYRPLHSTIGCMPTKLGEILAVGLPVVGNAIADLERILSGDVGVVVHALDDATLDTAARGLLRLAEANGTAASARERACAWFDLSDAVDAYDALYRRMPLRHGLSAAPVADGTWPPPARATPRIA